MKEEIGGKGGKGRIHREVILGGCWMLDRNERTRSARRTSGCVRMKRVMRDRDREGKGSGVMVAKQSRDGRGRDGRKMFIIGQG